MLLKLNNFGKFKNKSFEISDFITLFYGANESGKTTIFDSLMYLFSENKKSLGFSKMIKNRYGDEIDVESVPAIDDSIKLHPDSYNNLYAIRQSEIIFNMSDNKKDSKEWESEIKKKLFSSDIDIGKMISEIRAEYSGRAQSSIPYQINLMENKKNSIKEELNILYDKINNESSKKEKIKELNDKLNFNANLMREKIKEHDEIFNTFDLKKKAQLKNYKLDLLSLINSFYKKNNFLSENKILQNDYSNEIKSITNNIDELKNKEFYLNGKIESLKKNIEERKSI
ncbi:AAA family ATPase, partial [Brachyspira pilosicoli]|uniref:AAA family ATPase n=1 Tax=Brachyspira pilosicoli TaxID=52584 RepID=UPI001CA53870